MAQLTCKQHVVVSVQQARVAHHQDRERLPSKYIAMDLGKNLVGWAVGNDLQHNLTVTVVRERLATAPR